MRANGTSVARHIDCTRTHRVSSPIELTYDAAIPRADRPEPITMVDGRYRLDATLGVGGMGRVHLATDMQTNEVVAVKTLRPDLANDPLVRSRLQREASIAARVASRNVMQLLDHGEDPAVGPYIVFEHLSGESLADVLERQRTVEATEAVEIAIEVLQGLDAFHLAMVCHRDIKPDNVLITRERGLRGTSRLTARLIDFGLSRGMTATIDGTERVTMEGLIAGTPEYMAPEQIRDDANQDARVDIYAVGVMLYQMISGGLPFCGTEPDDVFERALYSKARPLTEVCPGIDPDLARIVHRAMDRDVAYRFVTARAMRLSLTDWLARYHAGHARALPGDRTASMAAAREAEERITKPARLRPRLVNPAAIVFLSACVTTAAVLIIARHHRAAPTPIATVLDAVVTVPVARPRGLHGPSHLRGTQPAHPAAPPDLTLDLESPVPAPPTVHCPLARPRLVPARPRAAHDETLPASSPRAWTSLDLHPIAY